MFDKIRFQCMERMVIMSKWCFNYETGNYEDIDRDGYS